MKQEKDLSGWIAETGAQIQNLTNTLAYGVYARSCKAVWFSTYGL